MAQLVHAKSRAIHTRVVHPSVLSLHFTLDALYQCVAEYKLMIENFLLGL